MDAATSRSARQEDLVRPTDKPGRLGRGGGVEENLHVKCSQKNNTIVVWGASTVTKRLPDLLGCHSDRRSAGRKKRGAD